MASQPPQRFTSQQPSPQEPSQSMSTEATASGQHRRSSIPQSTSSDDSQTVFLNHPSSPESSPKPEVRKRRTTPRPKPQTAPSTKEPRKCWICFDDETEDSPTSSQWRSPCPCALTAHEACLLDWVADLEAPSKRRTSSPKIECPQCKTKIVIARPQSPVIGFVRAIERVTGRLLLPSVFVTLAGTVITGCWTHGFSTVYLIFGPEDAERLLGIDNGSRISSNWGLGLPFIPMALIASRVTYTDNLLPIIPIFYFAFHAPRREGPLWPPSVAFTLASLPYVRAVYNELYRKFAEPKEKAWVKSVQPRASENENGEEQEQEQEQNQDEVANGNHEGLDFELGVQVEIIEEGEAEEPQRQAEQPVENAPVEAQEQAQAGQAQRPNPLQNQAPQNQPHHPMPHALPHHHQNPPQAANQGGLAAGQIVIDAIASCHLVIGALVFPSVSAAMGVLLKATLPKTWTNPPGRWDRYPSGFLQSRFGRSIVGGCLFVALKDGLLLYSKYRLARDHNKRRVVDFVAKKDRKTTASGS